MAESTPDIFINKIELAASIVGKEMKCISQINTLIKEINIGVVFKDELDIYPPYFECWQGLAELYDFVVQDYMRYLGKSEKANLRRIFDNYYENKKLKLEDLISAYKGVMAMMSKSGFHTVLRTNIGPTGLDRIDQRYHLGEYVKKRKE